MKTLVLSILTIIAANSALFAQGQGDVTFEVVAPTVVEAGIRFRIEFVVKNAVLEDIEFTPPTIEGFDVLAGPTSSYTSNTSIDFSTNTSVTVNASTYSYVLQGIVSGLHTISAAKVVVAGKSYSSKPVTIEVVSGVGADNDGAATGQNGETTNQGEKTGQGSDQEISNSDVFLRATASRTEVYKGEPVVVTLKFYARIHIAGLGNYKFPAFNGFWQQDITSGIEPVEQRETYNNHVYSTWVLKEYLLYPQQSGALTIDPLEATVNVLVQDNTSAPRTLFDEFFGRQNVKQVSKKIASQPLRIDVRELPEEGKPESFDGAVGDFRLEATPPPSAMKANVSGTYTMRLSGTGNFPLIRAPKLSLPQSFEQYNVTSSDNISNTRTGTKGYKEFSYPFIPRSDGLYTIPAFEFSYFDPQQRRYITHLSRETSIEIAADSTVMAGPGGGGMVSGVSREDLRVFGQDIQFIKRGAAGLRPKGQTFMFSPLYISLMALLVVMFVVGFAILPRYVRNMQSDRFVRGKRANKVALRRFRAAEISMKRDDRHGFYDEMLKALWGYMSDKFDIPMSDLTKERIREELFERNIPEAQNIEYVRIISECEEAQYSPVSSSRMGELYREGVALVSELESAIKRILKS